MKRKSRPASSAPVESAPASPAGQPPETQAKIDVPEHLLGVVADRMLAPGTSAAFSMNRMMDPCLTQEAGLTPAVVAKMLQRQAEGFAGGDLNQVRQSQAAQAATLEQMFHHFFSLASVGKSTPDICERFMRLALKAQSQATHTLQVLASPSGGPPVRSLRKTKGAPSAPTGDIADKAKPSEPSLSRTVDSGGKPATYVVKLPAITIGRRWQGLHRCTAGRLRRGFEGEVIGLVMPGVGPFHSPPPQRLATAFSLAQRPRSTGALRKGIEDGGDTFPWPRPMQQTARGRA